MSSSSFSPNGTSPNSAHGGRHSRHHRRRHSLTTEKVPPLLQRWRKLYLALPRIDMGRRLDVSLTLVTIVVLSSIRFLAEWIQIGLFGWPAHSLITKEASASVVGVVHSLVLVPSLVVALQTHSYAPSEPLKAAATWWQDVVNALLQFCTGYMIYDAMLNIVILKWDIGMTATDWMFVGHHAATALYMTSTRVVQAGHMSAMMCMLLGEATNPFQNTYYVAKFALTLDCCNGPKMQAFYAAAECTFCLLYLIVRVLIGPVVCAHMTWDLWTTTTTTTTTTHGGSGSSGSHPIPALLRAVWTFLIWAVIVGSIPWIQECWAILRTYVWRDANTIADEL